MQQVHDEAQSNEIFKAREGIYLGTLMSPAEVARATAGRKEKLKDAQRWTMCGDIDPDIFSMLQAAGHPQQEWERLTVFSGPSGARYAVVTHQAGPFQHRYVAPLFDAKVARCIRAVAHGDTFGYLLGGGAAHAAIWETRFGVQEFLPLLPLCSDPPVGREEVVLKEYLNTVLELRRPERIPSAFDGVAVRFASVSAISPKDLIKQVGVHPGLWG